MAGKRLPNQRMKLSWRGGRLKRERVSLDRGRRTTQLMRDSLGRITMMTRCSLAFILVVGACAPAPKDSSKAGAIATALDSLVPGVRIGAVAAPIAERLQLPVAPYVKYMRDDYRAAMGVRGVALQVNENLASETDRPSRSARIKGVVLTFSSPAAIDSVLGFLTRTIGMPDRYCYTPAYPPNRAALYFWPDQIPQGVLLVVRPKDPLHSFVAFGGIAPDSNSSFVGALKPGGCDAA